jgi:hypothetical protein
VSQEDIRSIDIKDAVLSAFQPIEHLFRLMDRVSLGDGGEVARFCSGISLELAQGFRRTLDRVLESLKAEAHHG